MLQLQYSQLCRVEGGREMKIMINPSKVSFKLGKYIKFEFIPRSAHCKQDGNMSIERRIF